MFAGDTVLSAGSGSVHPDNRGPASRQAPVAHLTAARGAVVHDPFLVLNLLRPHYLQAEHEGPTLVHVLLTASGDIHLAEDKLKITLVPLSSPHRTRAAQALCALLDQTATAFPGTRLRLRFAVRTPPLIGLAFPGSRAHRIPSRVPARPHERLKTEHFREAVSQEV